MILDYNIRGQVKITRNNFDKADPEGGGTTTSGAYNFFFRMDGDCEKQGPRKTQEFHNLVVKTPAQQQRSLLREYERKTRVLFYWKRMVRFRHGIQSQGRPNWATESWILRR